MNDTASESWSVRCDDMFAITEMARKQGMQIDPVFRIQAEMQASHMDQWQRHIEVFEQHLNKQTYILERIATALEAIASMQAG